MALQKEGVILAALGANEFIGALKKSTGAYDRFIGSLKKGEGASSQMGGGLDKLGSAAGAAKAGIAGLGAGVIAAGAAVVGVVAGVGLLTKKLLDLAKATAPIQGLQAQFDSLTQSVEGGSQAMLAALTKASGGMISNRVLFQKFNDAAALVSDQFAQDLPRALTLLTKVSAATGENMNFLFDSYVRGIGRVQPLIIDNLKVQVTVAEATAHATKMFGKQADQLTKNEQQLALTELTLAKLEEKFGALPDTAQTASAQMSILQANFQNIKDTLGQFLLPAFSSLLQGLNALAGAFNAAISEGGAFFPILVNIGAHLSILADGFRILAERAAQWLGNLKLDWTTDMGSIAEDAVMWGAEIVTNFAVGIIDAANTVLTVAMQQIQNILMWWLAPGSPPKVAPDLDKWGIAAFESYLKGMTEADFGILERIQGPLKKILEGPAFADVSKSFAAALAGGDRTGALEILAKSSSQFGDDVAELARREFALADATEAVKTAELALAAARDRSVAANKKVSESTREYNRLLRAGASKDILAAQLARINASEKERDAAMGAEKAAEAGIDTAKSRVETLKEQVDWQRRFLAQLFGIDDALTETEKREKAAAKATKGKGKGAPAVEPVRPGGAAGGIGGAIAAAIEAAKGRIKTALGGIWQTIKTEFSEKWNKAIGELGKTWDKFKDTVGESWDKLKEKYPFLQKVEDWLTDLPEKVKILAQKWKDKLHENFRLFFNFIRDELIPIFTGEKSLKQALSELWTFITESLIPAITGENGLGPVFTWLKDKVVNPLTTAWGWLIDKLAIAKQWIDDIVKALAGIPDWIIGQSPSPLAVGISTAADAMEKMARVSPGFKSAMTFQPAGAFSRPSSVSTSTQSNSFSFQTSVSDRMDAASLEAMILRTVRRAIATGAT